MSGSEAPTELIRTKLHPPRLPPIVPREGLTGKISSSGTAKLVAIVAGAGYGKSTLAAEFLEEVNLPYAWYRLDETDRDLPVFLTYLANGIRIGMDGFGARTLDRLSRSENVTLAGREILTTLLSELDEHLEEDAYVVLDDFQKVNDSAPVTDALEFLLSNAPSRLHLVILSRSRLNLDLEELRIHRELLELGEGDIRFNERETAALFSSVFGLSLTDEQAESLSRFTEGWVSGLLLVYLALSKKGPAGIEEAMRTFSKPVTEVYEYLSVSVYENQADEVKDFLVRTSILSRVGPSFCDELLGIDGSRGILSYLTDSRLFTIPMDDRGDWYRYHQLLRSFLGEVLETGTPEHETRRLHRRAASLWQERGEPEQRPFRISWPRGITTQRPTCWSGWRPG